MNAVEQCVPAGSGFPILAVLALIFIGICVYLWRSGKLGPANEAIIKAQLAKAKTAVAEWEHKLQSKTATASTSKAQRLAENSALLAAGTISQAEHDAARAAIINS